jgi:hypothetical protein
MEMRADILSLGKKLDQRKIQFTRFNGTQTDPGDSTLFFQNLKKIKEGTGGMEILPIGSQVDSREDDFLEPG